jgi:hypothetical protein
MDDLIDPHLGSYRILEQTGTNETTSWPARSGFTGESPPVQAGVLGVLSPVYHWAASGT